MTFLARIARRLFAYLSPGKKSLSTGHVQVPTQPLPPPLKARSPFGALSVLENVATNPYKVGEQMIPWLLDKRSRALLQGAGREEPLVLCSKMPEAPRDHEGFAACCRVLSVNKRRGVRLALLTDTGEDHEVVELTVSGTDPLPEPYDLVDTVFTWDRSNISGFKARIRGIRAHDDSADCDAAKGLSDALMQSRRDHPPVKVDLEPFRTLIQDLPLPLHTMVLLRTQNFFDDGSTTFTPDDAHFCGLRVAAIDQILALYFEVARDSIVSSGTRKDWDELLNDARGLWHLNAYLSRHRPPAWPGTRA